MIWGDLAPRYMTQYEAASYCKSIGAQLPDRGDFFRLRKYLGGGGEFEGLDGYRPQILPHLYYKIPDCCGGERDQSYDYWSSSVYPGDCKFAAAFAGLSGSMPVVNRGTPLPVRCVVQR